MIHYTNNYWVIALLRSPTNVPFVASTARHLGIKIITDPRYYKSHLILHSGYFSFSHFCFSFFFIFYFGAWKLENERRVFHPEAKNMYSQYLFWWSFCKKTETREPRKLYFCFIKYHEELARATLPIELMPWRRLK